MSKQEDGGPAFPTDSEHQSGPNTYHYSGISLRDYFAAKAMPVVYQRVLSGGIERVAFVSYELADAMLKERAK